jgi:hypothetical protein
MSTECICPNGPKMTYWALGPPATLLRNRAERRAAERAGERVVKQPLHTGDCARARFERGERITEAAA